MNHSQACEILGIRDGSDPDTIRKIYEKLNADISRQIEAAGSKFLRDTLVKNRKAVSEAYHLLTGDSSTDGSLAFSDAYKLLLQDESDSIELIEERFINLREEYEYGLRSPNGKIREIAAADLRVLSDVFEHIVANVKKTTEANYPPALLETIREEERNRLGNEFREKIDRLKKEHAEKIEFLEDRISSLSSEKTRVINDLAGILKLLSSGKKEEFAEQARVFEEKYGITGLSALSLPDPQRVKEALPPPPLPAPQPPVERKTVISQPEPGNQGFGLEEINLELADEQIDKMILKQSKFIDSSRKTDRDRTSRSEDGPLSSRTVAEKLFSEGRYEDALFYFKEAKEVEPFDYSLDVYINELEHLTGHDQPEPEKQHGKPQEDYEKVAYEETLKVANSLRSQKNFTEALEIYNSLLISDPENPYLLYCKSECEDGIKRGREVAVANSPNVKRPTITELLSLKSEGDERMNRKDFKGALELYQKALRINPKDLYVQIMIDQCERELGKV